jgi:hypothetical protein
MSTAQKLMYLDTAEEDATTGRKYRTFATQADYQAFMAKQ